MWIMLEKQRNIIIEILPYRGYDYYYYYYYGGFTYIGKKGEQYDNVKSNKHCQVLRHLYLFWSAYSLMIYITVYSLVMGFTE